MKYSIPDQIHSFNNSIQFHNVMPPKRTTRHLEYRTDTNRFWKKKVEATVALTLWQNSMFYSLHHKQWAQVQILLARHKVTIIWRTSTGFRRTRLMNSASPPKQSPRNLFSKANSDKRRNAQEEQSNKRIPSYKLTTPTPNNTTTTSTALPACVKSSQIPNILFTSDLLIK